MPGTKEGAKKGHATRQKKFGKNYLNKLASKGGKSHKRGGFASVNIGSDGLTGKERASKVSKEYHLRRKDNSNADQ